MRPAPVMTHRALGSLAGCLVSAAALAQTATFRAPLEQGGSLAYDMAFQSAQARTQPGEQTPTSETYLQNVGLSFRVVELREDGSADLAMTISRIEMEWITPNATVTYARPRVTTDVPADTPAQQAFTTVGEAIAGATIHITIGPDGEIQSVTGLDAVGTAVSQAPEPDARVVGVFSPAALAAAIEPIFSADGAAREPRDMGETWTSEEQTALGPAGRLVRTSEWKLLRIAGSRATIMGESTIKVEPAAPEDPGAPTVLIREQRGEVETTWDLEEGLIDRVTEQEHKTLWQLADLQLDQTTKGRIRLRKSASGE